MANGEEFALAKQYFHSVLIDNAAVKFLAGALAAGWTAVYGQYSEIIGLIVLAYVADFVLGFAVAAKRRRVGSWQLFKGGTKLGVYGILIAIGFGVDRILGFHDGLFITFMFASIFLRDSVSIVENLHALGYEVPHFVVKYLDVAQE